MNKKENVIDTINDLYDKAEELQEIRGMLLSNYSKINKISNNSLISPDLDTSIMINNLITHMVNESDCDFSLFEDLYGSYVRMNDRFSSVHIWSEALAKRNGGKWMPELISKKEYDKYKEE